jgi:hypothetical protein
MATQANQMSWGTQSPQSAGDTNYWQTGDLVFNSTQPAVINTTGTATISTNSITLPATAASLGVVSGMKMVGTGVPAETIVVSVSASTATISSNVTKALTTTPIQFLVNAVVPIGWICTQNGFPGVWEPINQSPTAVLTTTQTVGTLSPLYRLTVLNPASASTYSLPEANSVVAGGILSFKSIASGSITLTPLTTDQLDGGVAAVTLAQYSTSNLIAGGSTNWYRVGNLVNF